MTPLILHIGSTKTGSSAIQRFMWTNRVALQAHGILYPEVGIAAGAHHVLAAAIHPSAWRMHAADFAGRDRTAYFCELVELVRQAAARSSADRVFLSSEYLWGRLDQSVFARMSSLFESFEVWLLCYVRRQDEWLESTYVQSVKSGETRTFNEWLLAHLDKGNGFCHYDQILRQWEQFIPPERIHVRIYESAEGAMDSVADVLTFLAIHNREGLVFSRHKDNPSPTPQDVEIIRQVNRLAISPTKKQALLKIVLRNSQKKEPHTPFRYMSADETIELLRRYEPGNAAVAQMYLKSCSGQLFARPLPAPGAWPPWCAPPRDGCIARFVELISELLPE